MSEAETALMGYASGEMVLLHPWHLYVEYHGNLCAKISTTQSPFWDQTEELKKEDTEPEASIPPAPVCYFLGYATVTCRQRIRTQTKGSTQNSEDEASSVHSENDKEDEWHDVLSETWSVFCMKIQNRSSLFPPCVSPWVSTVLVFMTPARNLKNCINLPP